MINSAAITADQPTGHGPPIIAAAIPPVRIVNAIEAGISRRRVSAALARAVGGFGVIVSVAPRR
jgi:hypothetical protein